MTLHRFIGTVNHDTTIQLLYKYLLHNNALYRTNNNTYIV